MKQFQAIILFFFIYTIGQSQVVDIPDENFKNALLNQSPIIDTNGDGNIQISEAQSTFEVRVFESNISDLTGIEEFVNLRVLSFQNNMVASLDVSTMISLEELSFSNNNISSLDLSSNISLKFLICEFNPITSLDFSNATDLEVLNISGTNISEIDLSQNFRLESVNANSTAISFIDVSSKPNLGRLSLSNTELNSINLLFNSKLQVLDVHGTNLTEIDLSNNADLKVLNISSSNISSLDVTSNFDLELLEMSNSLITNLNLDTNLNLRFLGASSSNLETLDLSNNTQLCGVITFNNESMRYINLRNERNFLLDGSNDCAIFTDYGSFGFQNEAFFFNSPSLEFICVDNVAFAEENFVDIPDQTVLIEDCTLSLNAEIHTTHILYPNPIESDLNIKSQGVIDRVVIFSLKGKRLFHTNVYTKETRIDFSNYTSGIYFVKVTSSGVSETRRLVKK